MRIGHGNLFEVYNKNIFASYINNSYAEDERFDLGYFDRFRRLLFGGVTYVF